MNHYYTCLLTHQSIFSHELLYDLIHEQPAELIETQLIRFVNHTYCERAREQSREGVRSNQSGSDLYNLCWLELIHKIHARYSAVFSITCTSQSVLLARWYSLSLLQQSDMIEKMEYQGIV